MPQMDAIGTLLKNILEFNVRLVNATSLNALSMHHSHVLDQPVQPLAPIAITQDRIPPPSAAPANSP